MKSLAYYGLCLYLLVPAIAWSTESNWPSWRGPLSTGVAPQGDPPKQWSEDKNVRWKTALPGSGHSSPIVWGDRVFLTTAIPFGPRLEPKPDTAPGAHDNSSVTQRHRFVALAINRRNGRVVWQKTLHESLPHEGGHFTGTLASASPVTDGKHLFAYFGSHGLYCLDFQGELKWKRSFGRMQTKHAHGEGSSPALFGRTLIVNWDHESQSFVEAINTESGKTRWKKKRDEVTSWATPIIVQSNGKTQVIISGTGRVRSYDIDSGDVIWECGGLPANIVASPVANKEMVFAGSSYVKRGMLAIRLSKARGDITGSKHVAWTKVNRTPYVPSPLLYGKSLYYLRHYQGILTRITAKSGEEKLGPFRLGQLRDIYASPVGAANRVYITGRSGATLVISHNDDGPPTVISQNRLNDSFSASAAIAGRELFLRGEKYLYCIAEAAP